MTKVRDLWELEVLLRKCASLVERLGYGASYSASLFNKLADHVKKRLLLIAKHGAKRDPGSELPLE